MTTKIINQIIHGVVAVCGLAFAYFVYINTHDSTLATAVSMAIVTHYFSTVAQTKGSDSALEGMRLGLNANVPSQSSQKPVG